MRTTIHIVFTILVALAVGCRSPELTHCPELDCPGDKVCDGNGGCAFPEQLEEPVKYDLADILSAGT